MSRTIEVRAVRRRKKLCATSAQGRLATGDYANPAKTAIMSYARQLAGEGRAQWITLGSGTIELTLLSGEVFHLDKASVTRIG
jgi:hypothetical protein